MTKALSVDLRERVARYVALGHSRRQAARVFGISVSSAIRYVAQHQASGHVEPKRQGGDRRSKLKAHQEYILGRVAQVPDITLAELCEELAARGTTIHLSNLCRFLLAQGLTYKKNATGSRTKATGRLAGQGNMDCSTPANHAPTNPPAGFPG